MMTQIKNQNERTNSMITISLYHTSHQPKIIQLIAEIATEFTDPISHNQNRAPSIHSDQHLLAFHKNELVGTIAILKIKDKKAILNSMFVKKSYRGKEYGIANLLLNNLLDYCHEEHLQQIFLGTMTQFIAAQKFYKNNGFNKIAREELPEDFIDNPLDDVYFKKML